MTKTIPIPDGTSGCEMKTTKFLREETGGDGNTAKCGGDGNVMKQSPDEIQDEPQREHEGNDSICSR